jgi:hypothetical protein
MAIMFPSIGLALEEFSDLHPNYAIAILAIFIILFGWFYLLALSGQLGKKIQYIMIALTILNMTIDLFSSKDKECDIQWDARGSYCE